MTKELEKIEYRKQYYQKNKDKLNKQMKEYKLKNKDKIKTQRKEYYEKNKEKIISYQKDYYKQNKEKRITYQKKYYKQNKDKIIKNIILFKTSGVRLLTPCYQQRWECEVTSNLFTKTPRVSAKMTKPYKN